MIKQIVAIPVFHSPALIVAAGDRATYRFLEFFTAQIGNANPRRAYSRAVGEFCVRMAGPGYGWPLGEALVAED